MELHALQAGDTITLTFLVEVAGPLRDKAGNDDHAFGKNQQLRGRVTAIDGKPFDSQGRRSELRIAHPWRGMVSKIDALVMRRLGQAVGSSSPEPTRSGNAATKKEEKAKV